jgi:hypothetical protein
LAKERQIRPRVKALSHAISLHAKCRQIDRQQKRESGARLHKRIAQKQGEPACIFDPKWICVHRLRKRQDVSLEVVEVEATHHDVTDD